MEIREVARQIIEKELKAVKNVSSKLGDEIEAAVKAMHECKGRIVISGLGKSGHIGKSSPLPWPAPARRLSLCMLLKPYMEI